MGKTKIEWCSHSWNPLRVRSGGFGCTKISPGCEHCYAGRMNKRLFGGRDYDYKFRPTDFYLDEKSFLALGTWRKPRSIFICSMCDLFHENVPDAVTLAIFNAINSSVLNALARGEGHKFILLTKRAAIARDRIRTWIDHPKGGHGKPGCFGDKRYVHLGTTVCNQEEVDLNIPILLDTLVASRFISVEPMLGPIKLVDSKGWSYLDDIIPRLGHERPGLDGVICGGETGPGARPLHPDWVRSLRDECVDRGLPFHFKQWGEWIALFDQQAHDVPFLKPCRSERGVK